MHAPFLVVGSTSGKKTTFLLSFYVITEEYTMWITWLSLNLLQAGYKERHCLNKHTYTGGNNKLLPSLEYILKSWSFILGQIMKACEHCLKFWQIQGCPMYNLWKEFNYPVKFLISFKNTKIIHRPITISITEFQSWLCILDNCPEISSSCSSQNVVITDFECSL